MNLTKILTMKKLGLVLILCIIFLSCEKKEITHSFCYWKTGWYDSQEDSLLKKQMNVKHFYVRFFDVDWNPYDKEALPVATLNGNYNPATDVEMTPSIFITNEVLLNSDKDKLDVLAKNIDKRIDQILEGMTFDKRRDFAYAFYKKSGKEYSQESTDSIIEAEKNNFKIKVKEVLIDCDWSIKSKDNYFYLLQKLKENKKYEISATIRLWQYKYYEKAGIPPVDKGLLMCYNLSNPNDKNTENSIGTSKELDQYITHDKYDLPLDIALPIFSWSVVFRGNEFKGIISDENNINFKKDTLNFKRINDNKFVFKTDMVISETYFRNGDEVRIEQVADEEIQRMIRRIKSKITLKKNTKITFFSWDPKFIKNYGTDKINSYYAQFER
jgi:hypothetical protein